MTDFPLSPPLICLAGPTASGKSALARAIADRWPTEIINVDSATIYRGMDIGTAKPDATERLAYSHHLLDIRDPSESYSAASFRQDALDCAKAIRSRGRLPLLVGGTMLYFKALRDGLNDLPEADPEIRQQLELEAKSLGWPSMHGRLATIDPITAQRLAPNDSQRIGRALEIFLITGRPMSELVGKDRPGHTATPTITISLEPDERRALHDNIERRFDQMLEMGLVTEVKTLFDRKDLNPSLPAIRCVGYRQLWAMLDGQTSMAQAREAAIAATRQLAKRQLTWLRSLPDRNIVNCFSTSATQEVIDLISPIAKNQLSRDVLL